MTTSPPTPTGSLPRFIDTAELRTMLPMGRTTFYKLISQPEFPTPIKLIDGGDYLWHLDEVLAYLDTRRQHPGTAAPRPRRVKVEVERPGLEVRAGHTDRRRRDDDEDAGPEVTVRPRRTRKVAA